MIAHNTSPAFSAKNTGNCSAFDREARPNIIAKHTPEKYITLLYLFVYSIPLTPFLQNKKDKASNL